MIPILFQCRDCEGNVIECFKDGRFYEHRKVLINLPIDFGIPTCMKCGQHWFSQDLIKRMEAVLEAEYLKDADLIRSIVEFHNHQQQK
jgi:hypothetical protein